MIPVLRSLSNVIPQSYAVTRQACPCAASSIHTNFFIFPLPFLYMLILVCFVLLIQKEQIIFLLDLDNLLDLAYNRNRNSLLSYSFPEVFIMSESAFVNDARVMAKGQVTIPKNVRIALGIETGDRVTFIVDGNNIRVVNSAVYAMMRLQEQMKGEAEKAGFFTEEDVAKWITQSRREESAE